MRTFTDWARRCAPSADAVRRRSGRWTAAVAHLRQATYAFGVDVRPTRAAAAAVQVREAGALARSRGRRLLRASGVPAHHHGRAARRRAERIWSVAASVSVRPARASRHGALALDGAAHRRRATSRAGRCRRRRAPPCGAEGATGRSATPRRVVNALRREQRVHLRERRRRALRLAAGISVPRAIRTAAHWRFRSSPRCDSPIDRRERAVPHRRARARAARGLPSSTPTTITSRPKAGCERARASTSPTAAIARARGEPHVCTTAPR